MPIVGTDVIYRLSGGSANTNPNSALGGAMSSTAIVDNVAQNLFDNVSGTESRDGDTEYRCFFVLNNHGTLTFQNARIWLSALTPSADDEVDIALSEVSPGTTDDRVIANEGTDPNASPNNSRTALVFSRPTTSGTALTIGDIAPGQRKGIWVRRVVNAGAGAYTNNTFTWTCEGETLG